jgi:hypothetical protein
MNGEVVNVDEPAIPLWQMYLCGAMTGVCTSTAMCGAEVTKVRLQFAGQKIGAETYAGPFDCFMKILRQEGVAGLFKGYNALLLRDVPYNCIFFGAYESICHFQAKLYGLDNKDDLNPAAIFMSGGLAGMAGWAAIFPADVIKSTMQAQNLGDKAPGIIGTIRTIYARYGVNGFLNGFNACILRAFPANAALFTGVELTTRAFRCFEELE